MRIALTLAFTLTLLSATADAKTLGIAIANASDKFQGALLKGMTDSAAGVQGLKITVADAKADPATQMEQLKKFAADKVDAIVIGPADGDLGVQMSKIANDAGIPLVYINNQPINYEELPPRQTVVASDELESGTLQAKEACRLLGGKGKAVLLMGQLFHQASRIRTTDVEQVFSTDACKGMTIVEKQSANWSTDQADELTQEWLDAGVKFDAVLANNDEMALGAIRALKRNGISMDKVVIGGVDATDDALKAMVNGDLDITVLQNAKGLGKAAVEAAVKLTDGQTLPTAISVPFELVTPANVQTYLAKSQ
ncbi:ribose transport system substrate-binding protein/inositol transport system substrate-binding protein [Agrobacterium vitis]|nr:ribose transport system substrate-binding protein/inositol transport system substrate-binding protein [Agrobacterium vitis]MBE1439806.1 ribose transport system substrate-binding protein/inositol transport system substrate-binding protein [Agrobacterium vitis]